MGLAAVGTVAQPAPPVTGPMLALVKLDGVDGRIPRLGMPATTSSMMLGMYRICRFSVCLSMWNNKLKFKRYCGIAPCPAPKRPALVLRKPTPSYPCAIGTPNKRKSLKNHLVMYVPSKDGVKVAPLAKSKT